MAKPLQAAGRKWAVAETNDGSQAHRAAENQSRFRSYNERIEAHNRATHWVDPPMPEWVCECASVTCAAPVHLTIEEYESIREDGSHFLVIPGDDHVVPQVERIVERNERYWVVEKLGEAGDLTEELDPRTDDVATPQDDVVAHADRKLRNLSEPPR
jgi:hypothetical protein